MRVNGSSREKDLRDLNILYDIDVRGHSHKTAAEQYGLNRSTVSGLVSSTRDYGDRTGGMPERWWDQ